MTSVRTGTCGVINLPSPFSLQGGEAIKSAQLAYRTYGNLHKDKSNAILICHALTGNQFAADTEDLNGVTADRHGWWDAVVGPGLAIDTGKYFVVCANIIGGCDGSTGPVSINPDTQKPWGEAFPRVDVDDWVRSQAHLADELGIDVWHAVIGGSLGGMQAMRWATLFPDRLKLCVGIAMAPKLSAQNIAFNFISRRCLQIDTQLTPNPDANPQIEDQTANSGVFGLSTARMLGHLTYLSESHIDERFGNQMQKQPRTPEVLFQVESYLTHLAQKFIQGGFDRHTYTLATHALDSFDLGRGSPLKQALQPCQASFLLVSYKSDWRFPPSRSQEIVTALTLARKKVKYLNIDLDKGHDSFLFENARLTQALTHFLDHPPNKTANNA